MEYVYLDNAATTPPDSEIVQKMMPYFGECYGNADSRILRNHLIGSDGKSVLGVVVDTLGAEGKLSVVVDNLYYLMRYNRGSIPCGIVKGNDIVHLDILRVDLFTDDDVPTLDIGIHGVG